MRRLRDLGAGVIAAPVIRIEPIAGAPIDASAYDLVCLTSPNAPALLLERIGGDARLLAGVEVAAIGPGTAAAIRAVGILPDIVAERAVAEGLLEALAGRVAGRRVLVARAEEARDTLPDGLRDAGAATVDVVPLYRTVADVPDGTDAPAADLVTFTSSSTVRFFHAAFADRDLGAVRASRSARSRPRRCASSASRSSPRPPRTTSTAWSPPSSRRPGTGSSSQASQGASPCDAPGGT